MDDKRFEKTSSAEVSINSKGQASYMVKVYFDADTTDENTVADKIQGIMEELRRRFN